MSIRQLEYQGEGEAVEIHPEEETDGENVPFFSQIWFHDDNDANHVIHDYTVNISNKITQHHLERDLMSLTQPLVLHHPISLSCDKIDNCDDSLGRTNHIHYTHPLVREEVQRRIDIIHKWMGSMAQCRGDNGNILRQAGAIQHLLQVLYDCIPFFQEYHTLYPFQTVENHRTNIPYKSNTYTYNRRSHDAHHTLEKTEVYDHGMDVDDDHIYELLIGSLGALRDLSCGNSLHRQAMGDLVHHDNGNHQIFQNGMEMIAFFIQRKRLIPWRDMVDMCPMMNPSFSLPSSTSSCTSTSTKNKELKLFTAACGVIRNTTHSNRRNCDIVQELGLPQLFIWRLLHSDDDDNYDETTYHGTSNIQHPEHVSNHRPTQKRLPHTTIPWREACFRMVSSLLNIAQYNNDCATLCASNDTLMELLILSWDDHLFQDDEDDSSKDQKNVTAKKGRSIPLLHAGLTNILIHYSLLNKDKEYGPSKLNEVVQGILIREEKRKMTARIRQKQSPFPKKRNVSST